MAALKAEQLFSLACCKRTKKVVSSSKILIINHKWSGKMFVDVSFSYREDGFAHGTPYILHSTVGERPLSELQPVWKHHIIRFTKHNLD